MSITIRRAQGTEVSDARDLTNRSWLSTYPPLIGQAETEEIVATRHSAEVFREQAGRVQDRFLVALQIEKVVGHLYAFQKDGMYVDRLHVDPDMKGLGIGKALLRDVEQGLRDRAQRLILVDTSSTEDFARTRDFYLKNGYEEEARIRDFWSGGDDKVMFRKAL